MSLIMKKGKDKDSTSTIFGTDSGIEGVIEFKDNVWLYGNVKGKISSADGTVVIGSGAVIRAEITVGKAIVRGEVTGSIDAKNKIEVYPPARILGDIKAPVVLIKAGVILNGNCCMKISSNFSGGSIEPQKISEIETRC